MLKPINLCDPREVSSNYEELLANTEERDEVEKKWEKYGLMRGLTVRESTECAVLFEVIARAILKGGDFDTLMGTYSRTNSDSFETVVFPVIRRTYAAGSLNGENVGEVANDLKHFWDAAERSALIDAKAILYGKEFDRKDKAYIMDNVAELAAMYSDMVNFKYGGRLEDMKGQLSTSIK